MITQYELKQLIEYNPVTGIFKWKVYRNSNAIAGSVSGNIHDNGYRYIKVYKKLYRASRLAWLYMTGSFPSNHIDHRNGIRDDDRWENLREATRSQNHQNIILKSNNTSGYMGVNWSKKHKKWAARIGIDGKRIFLGRFDTPEEAYEAYLKAKKEYHNFQPIPRRLYNESFA